MVDLVSGSARCPGRDGWRRRPRTTSLAVRGPFTAGGRLLACPTHVRRPPVEIQFAARAFVESEKKARAPGSGAGSAPSASRSLTASW
jgi:hypothetical protein